MSDDRQTLADQVCMHLALRATLAPSNSLDVLISPIEMHVVQTKSQLERSTITWRKDQILRNPEWVSTKWESDLTLALINTPHTHRSEWACKIICTKTDRRQLRIKLNKMWHTSVWFKLQLNNLWYRLQTISHSYSSKNSLLHLASLGRHRYHPPKALVTTLRRLSKTSSPHQTPSTRKLRQKSSICSAK